MLTFIYNVENCQTERNNSALKLKIKKKINYKSSPHVPTLTDNLFIDEREKQADNRH